MKKLFYVCLCCLLSVSCRIDFKLRSSNSMNALKHTIKRTVAGKKADVGVSVLGIEDGGLLRINNRKHFSMQSVFKFPIVLSVLHEVDNGSLSLNEKVIIKKSELLSDTWSPLRDKYNKGDTDFTLADVIEYTVSQSDNNGCDILLRLVGGPEKVNDYIHCIGIKDMQIVARESEMHKDVKLQFKNWTTPEASTKLLKLFYTGKLLSKKSFDFLWKVMLETETGGSRIKGNLPVGTPVAHKTGTSGPGKSGITAAVNDIGIVTLPNGKHFAISVFVADSREDYRTNEKIIADISESAWNYFMNKTE